MIVANSNLSSNYYYIKNSFENSEKHIIELTCVFLASGRESLTMCIWVQISKQKNNWLSSKLKNSSSNMDTEAPGQNNEYITSSHINCISHYRAKSMHTGHPALRVNSADTLHC